MADRIPIGYEEEEGRMHSDFRSITRNRGQTLRFVEKGADHFWLG